jgi:hypothetical protein
MNTDGSAGNVAKCAYRNVTVYSMQVSRNNVGDWPIKRQFGAPTARHDRHDYGIKDLAMTKDATWGFMLWNGASKGTLANVVNLLNTKKKTLLYLGPQFRNSLSYLTDPRYLSSQLSDSFIISVRGTSCPVS